MNHSNAVRVDRTKWSREELFSFFSHAPLPFYSISFTVDVTRVVDFSHKNKVSFYLSLIHLATRALNSVENFRYTIRNGEVWLLDERHPSYTDMHRGSDVFHIVTPGWNESLLSFIRDSASLSESQHCFIDLDREADDLFYVSCLPSLRMTAITSKHSDPDDCVPALTWGAYEDHGGRKELCMTLEVNHRFIDGIHVSMFARKLDELIAEL